MTIRAKRALVVALLVAIPIEAVNFAVFTPPLDVDSPAPDAPWLVDLIEFQWVILHYLGLRISSWLYGWLPGSLFPTLAIVGYLDTALLLFVLILCGQMYSSFARNRRSP